MGIVCSQHGGRHGQCRGSSARKTTNYNGREIKLSFYFTPHTSNYDDINMSMIATNFVFELKWLNAQSNTYFETEIWFLSFMSRKKSDMI